MLMCYFLDWKCNMVIFVSLEFYNKFSLFFCGLIYMVYFNNNYYEKLGKVYFRN